MANKKRITCTGNRHDEKNIGMNRAKWFSTTQHLFATVCLSAALIGAMPADAAKAAPASKDRFRFCRGIDDGCTQPGKGYTVCERLLKMFNARPKDAPLPVCELELDPAFTDFALPKWAEISVDENLRMVYDIEMFLLPPGQHLKPFSFQNPATWRGQSFEDWLYKFKERRRKGEIEPRLWQTRATLNENGPETLVAYERAPGGNIKECRERTRQGGMNIFVATQNPEQPVKQINSVSSKQTHLLIHKEKGFFVNTYGGRIWEFWIQAPMSTNPLVADLGHVTTQRCAFDLNN